MSAVRPPLRDQVRDLLLDAAQVYGGTGAAARFERAAGRLDDPLLVAIAGRAKAGKSTLLNALVGQVVAATDAGECTRVVTAYSWGPVVSAAAILATGPVEIPVRPDGGQLAPDLSGLEVAAVQRLAVQVPSASLRRVTLLDTPGIGSLTPEAGRASERFVSEDPPDAVIYLLRQLHVTDVDFLEAFRDPVGRTVPPVNSIGVLSHADEIGGGRADALSIASRLAEGYAAEPRMRPLVQTVVPVAGLLAEAAATLTAAEHADLVALAGVSDAVTAPMVLSAARFGAPRRYLPVDTVPRQALLSRLGLFGVRWALDLVRAGRAGTVQELRSALLEVSGAGVLNAVLGSQITGRRDLLKADAALQLVLRTVAGQPVRDAARLSAAAERIRIGVHDFDELRLLNDLRLGALEVDEAERTRMERLLGARGGGLPDRLGRDPGTPAGEVLEAVRAEHAHWHRVGSDVLASPMLTRACAVLERTCVQLHSRAQQPAPTGR